MDDVKICSFVVYMLLSSLPQVDLECNSIITEQWITSGAFHHAYYVTPNQYDLRTCESICQSVAVNSTLARIGTSMLTRQFQSLLCLRDYSFWIKAIRSKNPCDIMRWPQILPKQDCSNDSYHCICQQKTNVPSMPKEPPLKDFTHTLKNNYYRTVYKKLTYGAASAYCLTHFNSSLMIFTSLFPYIEITESLPLEKGSYWIYRKDVQHNVCLVANKEGNVTISKSLCDVKHYAICNHVIDTSLPLRDVSFVKMISNMTVYKTETKKWLNKLQCADDRRKSAQVVGEVGVIFIVVVITLIICLDSQRVFSLVYRAVRRHFT